MKHDRKYSSFIGEGEQLDEMIEEQEQTQDQNQDDILDDFVLTVIGCWCVSLVCVVGFFMLLILL